MIFFPPMLKKLKRNLSLLDSVISPRNAYSYVERQDDLKGQRLSNQNDERDKNKYANREQTKYNFVHKTERRKYKLIYFLNQLLRLCYFLL